MKKLSPFTLSIASGILLWAAWPVSPLTPIIFVAFVPLLWCADMVKSRSKFFRLTYTTMFIWNLLTTWWIVNATLVGAIMAMLANSFLMCLPWLCYHFVQSRFGKRLGFFALICFWMAFEYIHLNWQLSWPWLNLGNVFANQPDWVQWYEFTGVGGGTLWVLLVNILMYDWLLLEHNKSKRSKIGRAVLTVALILVPVIVSYIQYETGKFANMKQARHSIVIIQPNIDPYSKFDQASIGEQMETLLQLSRSSVDNNTELLIWPETALSSMVAVNEVDSRPEYQPVFQFLQQHPQLTLLTGIETYKWYGNEKPASPYARKATNGGYYDSYNAAITLQVNQRHQFYIKSKLVPGVETLPTFLNFLGPVFEQFGGTTGGYAKDTASVAFKLTNHHIAAAPIICYESIYGGYVASYVQKGANLLTIITNDGWWGNTPGHKQHLAFARLRAIETRKWVARSANTGISAVIDSYGNINETQPWDKAAFIKASVPLTDRQTFYVKHGDYIYNALTLLAGLLVLLIIASLIFRKKRTK